MIFILPTKNILKGTPEIMLDFQKDANVIAGVRGSISLEEAELLYRCAGGVREGCIVEVGSWRGKSTIAMARAVLRAGFGVRVYAVDPHEAFQGVYGGQFGAQDRGAFFANMVRSGCFRAVRLLNVSSEVITPGWQLGVGMMFIDGDHTYRGVKRDFECWCPYLVPGACIAFDDAKDPNMGPYKLISQLVDSPNYKYITDVGKVVVVQKT
jgi:hypothetical protein